MEAQTIFDSNPLLTRISAGMQARVRSEMRPMRAADGQQLFGVYDRCTALPLIAGGTIRVLKPLRSGRVVPLYCVGPGDLCVLSVSCLVGDVRYPAEGTAAGDVAGAMLPGTLFRALVDQEPAFRHDVFGAVATRLCMLMAVVAEVTVPRLDERLADLLVTRGPVVRATHQALADELGTAREVVSRILENFEAEGHVRLRRANVEVLQPFGLIPRRGFS